MIGDKIMVDDLWLECTHVNVDYRGRESETFVSEPIPCVSEFIYMGKKYTSHAIVMVVVHYLNQYTTSPNWWGVTFKREGVDFTIWFQYTMGMLKSIPLKYMNSKNEPKYREPVLVEKKLYITKQP